MSIVKILPFWKFPSSSSGKGVVAINAYCDKFCDW